MAQSNVNKIDIHEFIALRGQVLSVQEASMINHRPGIDKPDISLLGKQSQPFNLQSRVNAKSVSDGWLEFFEYEKLVGGDAVDIIKDGFEFKSVNLKFFVQRVVPIAITARITTAGGIVGKAPNEGFIIASWTLLAITTI